MNNYIKENNFNISKSEKIKILNKLLSKQAKFDEMQALNELSFKIN